jgi:hypothetical protein
MPFDLPPVSGETVDVDGRPSSLAELPNSITTAGWYSTRRRPPINA